MPATAVELYRTINDELGYIGLEWKVFETIFTDANREILDRAAPGFFEVLHLALQRDVFIGLARLTDPTTTGRYENISLQAMIESLPVGVDRAELNARLAAMAGDITPIRGWRMKYLAHNDLEHGLGRQILPSSSRDAVRRVLQGAAEIVQRVGQVVSPSNIPVPLESAHRGGAGRLLKLLTKALQDDDGHLTYE